MITYSIIQKSQLEDAHRIDAEYFMPEFLDIATHLDKSSSQRLDFLGTITASAFYPAATEYYSIEGLPFIRVVDVIDYPIIDESQNIERIPEEFISKTNGIALLKKGDIVISKVGTPCYASIVGEKLDKVALTRTVLGIKNIRNINPLYLLAFLRSKYGFYQLMREMEQQIQLQLTLDRVRRIKIFIPTEENQKKIADLILNYYSSKKDREFFYRQAENLLLEELGLKDFQLKDDLSYKVNFSDVGTANRVDAEFFQPKYDQLISKLKSQSSKPLGDLVSVKKGFEPGSEAYQEEGKLFIRVSSLSKFGIENKDHKYLNNDLYQKLNKGYKPQVGEILLTKDATPGIAYVVKEPIEGIISGGILRLKLKENIDPEYLALCINSLVGQMQAERDAGGSIIVHWRPEQIKNIIIPILPLMSQQKIADLVRKSHEARKKSKELLEEAKRKVEEMIEKGNKS